MTAIVFAVGSFVSYRLAFRVGDRDPETATGLIVLCGFLAVCALALLGNYIFNA